MLKSVLLVGASAVALAAIAAPARADNITTNQWYNGFLTTNGTSLIAGSGAGGTNGPILPGGVANASAAPTTGGILSGTITLPSGGYFLVTDVEKAGDQFQMYVNGSPATPMSAGPLGGQQSYNGTDSVGTTGVAGLTSLPGTDGAFCTGGISTADISCSLANPDFSSGTFVLPPGTDTITGIYVGNDAVTGGAGDMDYIVEAIPEPASLALFGTGLLALGAAIRRRRSRGAASPKTDS
ncbi:MAG TPA: PEP-CTERM sorting domain-containing protein [Acetobacteraceae bacterium]|jgi:hypothetical protein|nr:PEP-CTERM sorting domain-containing protein [Acetobacteraceae bacterium]